MKPNINYGNLQESYLFRNIAMKVKAYQDANPDKHIYRLGIGDVTLPLADEVIKALHRAVDDQASADTFHGYMNECGAAFLRHAIAGHYKKRGVELSEDEVFVSSGASDELGDILDLFAYGETTALIMEPAYPAYVDANIMAGRKIIHLATGAETGFIPLPGKLEADGKSSGAPNEANYDASQNIVPAEAETTENSAKEKPDVIYICSPNNPTGAVMNKARLTEWVDYANKNGAVILFDAAYEAFIEEPDVPHSIYEIEGARNCAIEICSLSKTAGFTGTRCGYTVIPTNLVRSGMSLRDMWVRNRTTKTNGVSYIIQRGAEAVFTEKGQEQIKANIAIYKENARRLMRALDAAKIKYFGGKNAPYVWMQCPNGLKSWECFDLLLNEIQVVGTPGAGFGSCGEGFFRFSSFGSPEDTAEAARRIYELWKS
ncbi:MAG: aminotransferase class I/II-fold pyridoxal phosphate-dependent enzyme [Lachnospiraceae bacterium]|nr:aminotransferase class I/II-fold pyridoxal phosphate-dependent enzyme [Lachnospiraceae bacterium]